MGAVVQDRIRCAFDGQQDVLRSAVPGGHHPYIGVEGLFTQFRPSFTQRPDVESIFGSGPEQGHFGGISGFSLRREGSVVAQHGKLEQTLLLAGCR